jgi:hypothetical protein
MTWTDLHGGLLGKAFERVLGKPAPGAVGFVRCLTTDVVEALGRDAGFAPRGW